MLARLCWKEFRMMWPLWLMVGLCAVGLQWFLMATMKSEVQNGMLIPIALGWTSLYAFAVGAASFAGERENSTMLWLDTLPMSRDTVWRGKVFFGLGTTLLLGLLLVLWAALATVSPIERQYSMSLTFGGVGVLVLEALAWSFFWSSLLRNALTSAVLSVCSVGFVILIFTGDVGLAQWDTLAHLFLSRLLIIAVILGLSWFSLTRLPLRQRSRRLGTGGESFLSVIPLRNHGRRIWAVLDRPMFDTARILDPIRTMRSLFWATVRESRSSWLCLFAIAVVVVIASRTMQDTGEGFFSALVPVALLLGINVFARENRSRAFAFYEHHGVRPRAVWLAKEITLFLGLILFIIFAAMLVLWSRPHASFGVGGIFERWGVINDASNRGGTVSRLEMRIALVIIMVLNAFAIGQLCGLVIRRGLTAGVVALLVFCGFLLPQGLLVEVNMVPLGALLLTPATLMLIGFLWVGDWMSDRPGSGKWIKLGFLLIVPSALLASAFVGYRAWSLPKIPAPFEVAKFRSPVVTPEENAAELYRKASIQIQDHMTSSKQSVEEKNRLEYVLTQGWAPEATAVVQYWKSHLPALDLVRQAVKRPKVLFDRIENLTLKSTLDPSVPGMRQLGILMALDAQEKESREDFVGAWNDVLTIFEMARQLSLPPAALMQRWSASAVHETAVNQAILWAYRPGQSPDMLRKALDDVLKLAPMPNAIDSLKAEYVLLSNTIRLPFDELAPVILGPPQKSSTLLRTGLRFSFISAPWERKRTQRVLDMIVANALREAHIRSLNATYIEGISKVPEGLSLWPIASLQLVVEGLKTTPLAKILLDPLTHRLDIFDLEKTREHALIQILALRIWQFEHGGDYPRSLHELVPSILKELPLDPFSGKIFQYVQSKGQSLAPLGAGQWSSALKEELTTPGQWLLYSVGPNHVDDGAQKSYPASFNSDLVYPLPMKRDLPSDPTKNP